MNEIEKDREQKTPNTEVKIYHSVLRRERKVMN